jgi:hypothetical protein
MQLIQTWPEELRSRHDAHRAKGWRLFAVRDYEGSAAAFDAAYRALLDAQPPGRRYHKGESLLNKGLASMWAGAIDVAVEETLAAFIEDSASLAEENPKFEELDRPAAHNLVFTFNFAGVPLVQFAREVRAFINDGNLLPDPHGLLASENAPTTSEPVSGGSPERVLGDYRQPPDKRVFIAGWYGRLDGTLRPLGHHLAGLGYDGIIAADFGLPAGWGVDEIALSLLTDCHFAVFDVSESAGQVEEIAEVHETMRNPERVLAVFDLDHAPKPGISGGMSLAKLKRWGVEPIGYEDVAGLRRIVEHWLSGDVGVASSRAT